MSDVLVRTATVADALAVESVRIGTWRVAYRGLLPDPVLDALVVDAGRRAAAIAEGTATTLLAHVGGEPVGMAAFGPSRDPDLAGSELYALYVLPTSWGSGAGTALLAACGDVASLWVLDGNERAQAFYRRHGFARDGSTKTVELGAAAVEVRMVRSLG